MRGKADVGEKEEGEEEERDRKGFEGEEEAAPPIRELLIRSGVVAVTVARQASNRRGTAVRS